MFQLSFLASCWESESEARMVANSQWQHSGAFAILAFFGTSLVSFPAHFQLLLKQIERSYVRNRYLQRPRRRCACHEARVFWKYGSPRTECTWSFLWICVLCLVRSFGRSDGSFSATLRYF